MIKFLVGKRIPVFCVALLIIFMGFSAYSALPRESMPDIKIPYISVSAYYAGVSAKDMESLITSKIEQELDGMDGIKMISSNSRQGACNITLEFSSSVDVSEALRKTREKVDGIIGSLPADMSGPYYHEASSSDWQPLLSVVLSHPDGIAVIDDSAELMREELKKIKGVLDVEVSGSIEQELAIEIDPAKMEHFSLSMDDIEAVIRNEHVTIPGGVLNSDTLDYSLSVTGEIRDHHYFEELVIQGNQRKVKLKEVANVRLQTAPSSSYARLNGKPAITLTLKKRIGGNTVSSTDEAKALVHRMSPLMPEGTDITITNDSSYGIKIMILDLENSMITSILLVLLVTFIFLGKTNSIFVSLAIPFSMLITFAMVQVLGITLNMYVLFSLILGLGMLVDNGIVIVENIFRHAGMGKNRVQASIDGTKEVSGAIIASTLTTCLAFFPIIYMPGIMGEMLSFLPKTVIILLLASLFVGLTLTPVFCSTFLNISEKTRRKIVEGSGFFTTIQNLYHKLIHLVIKRSYLVALLAVIITASGVFLFVSNGKGSTFFREEDPWAVQIYVEAPIGTPINITDGYVKQIEQLIPGINMSLKNYTVFTGNGGSHKATINVEFEDYEDRTISGEKSVLAVKEALKNITGAKITVGSSDGGMGGSDISLLLTGEDYSRIGEISESIISILSQYKELKSYDSDYEASKPEYEVEIDREKAAFYGLSTTLIAMTIRQSMNGAAIGKFRQGKDEYDIVMRYTDESRNSLNSLKNLQIIANGKRIPLSSVATIKPMTSVASIKRRDLARAVSISAGFISDVPNKAELTEEILGKIDALKVDLPKGYDISPGSDSDMQQETTSFLGKAFMIALFLILIVLIVQFNSVADPFICLISALLSIGGVFWGFFIFGMQFEILMCGIASISLLGIAINNCIVLVDYTNLLIKQGYSWRDAIPEAGKTRLRPVVLTALTTVLALMPMGLAFSLDFRTFSIQTDSASASMWIAFAWALIFGLSYSTVMTLIFVPSLLAIKHSALERRRNRKEIKMIPPLVKGEEDLVLNIEKEVKKIPVNI